MKGSGLDQVYEMLDTLRDRNHSVLFYEEPEYGRMVEYHFMKTGLLRGESCIYATPDDDISVIERGMADFGLDVEGYKKKNLLHIYKVDDPQNDPNGLRQGLENIRKKITAESNPPLRIVGRFIRNFEEKEGGIINMYLERAVHSEFGKYQGSFMCPYPVRDISRSMEGNWMQSHLRNHHSAIFVLKGGQGLAIHMP